MSLPPTASAAGPASTSASAAAASPASHSRGPSASTAYYATTGATPLATPPSATLPSLLDRPISRGTVQVSLSAFSHLFAALVQYTQQRVDAVHDLEKKLADLGYTIGLRACELFTYRSSIQAFLLTATTPTSGGGTASNPYGGTIQQPIAVNNVGLLNGRKEKNLVAMLQFLHSFIWKQLFGRVADGLEKSTDKEDEYYVYDREPLTNRFISVPKELGHFNCATFIAGIVNGILDAAEFKCEVTAHFNTVAGTGLTRTVYVIKFEKEVTKRDS